MNPIIESNKEFAEKLLEKLAPRVTDGTGISGTLNAGDTGALYHIAQSYVLGLDDIAYPVVNLGHGQVEVAEGVFDDAYALMLGKNGGGIVGEFLQGNRNMTHEETLVVLKFHNVASLDVVLSRLNYLRSRMINNEPIEVKNQKGELIKVVSPSLTHQEQP